MVQLLQLVASTSHKRPCHADGLTELAVDAGEPVIAGVVACRALLACSTLAQRSGANCRDKDTSNTGPLLQCKSHNFQCSQQLKLHGCDAALLHACASRCSPQLPVTVSQTRPGLQAQPVAQFSNLPRPAAGHSARFGKPSSAGADVIEKRSRSQA